MQRRTNGNENGFFKSVMLAYTILGLHLLLVAGIVLLIIFLRGIVHYMLWIFLGGLLVVLTSAFYFFRKMRAQQENLKETLSSPAFAGRPVELSLLGGLASIRIGDTPPQLPPVHQASSPVHRLEDPETLKVRELTELAGLLEKDLITLDEYNQAKQKLLGS